jgi:thiol-disulfide isomerase/thioredoxin
MKNLITIIWVITVLGSNVGAQSVNINVTGNSIINQLCPEFSFDTLFNYKNEKLSLAELKGKFVIVDFWGTFCLPCIRAFPKLENMQKRFGDSLQILLIVTDGYQRAKHFYETRKKEKKPMVLPCAINKSMVKYFQLQGVPSYAWIDNKGYVRAVTDESQLTERNVSDFINGKMSGVHEREKAVSVNSKKPLYEIVKEIDSTALVFRSTLTRHLKGASSLTAWPKENGNINRFIAINMGIRNLYQLAYGDSAGSISSNRVIIESAHPEKLTQPKDGNFDTWKLENTYCYEIYMPNVNRDSILKMIRDDLRQLFGYNVYQEYRMQRCLILKAENNFRFLEDTTVTPKVSYNTGGIIVTNYPFQQLVGMIKKYLYDKIIFDETGLTGKVDITLNAMMNDVDALNKQLKKYGLRLQYEDRPVQMLVIKDPG